jgi:hypothetical protein
MDEEESMENQQQPQQEWTLQCSGLTIRQGDLVECEVAHRVRVATVKQVSVAGISMYGTRAGDQVVHVQLYKPARREGSGDRYVPATNVFRVLDAPPVPPAIVVELLYPKHAFHRYAKGKIHIVRHEITPLWGGPPVDPANRSAGPVCETCGCSVCPKTIGEGEGSIFVSMSSRAKHSEQTPPENA